MSASLAWPSTARLPAGAVRADGVVAAEKSAEEKKAEKKAAADALFGAGGLGDFWGEVGRASIPCRRRKTAAVGKTFNVVDFPFHASSIFQWIHYATRARQSA